MISVEMTPSDKLFGKQHKYSVNYDRGGKKPLNIHKKLQSESLKCVFVSHKTLLK